MKKKLILFICAFAFLLMLVACNNVDVPTTSSTTVEEPKTTTTTTQGTSNLPIVNNDTIYNVNYNLENTENDKFTLDEAVEVNGDKLYDSIGKTYEGFLSPTIKSHDDTIELYYNRLVFNLELSINFTKGGNVTGAGEYKYDEEVTLNANTNDGFTFLGWFEGNTLISDQEEYTFKMPKKNLSYEAKYKYNKYTVTFDNQTNGKVTTIGVTSGNKYTYTEQMVVNTTNTSDNFIAWSVDDKVVHVGDRYEFSLPAHDVTIKISLIESCIRNDSKVYFGSYPQSKVEEESVVNNLNELAGELPTNTDPKTWTNYINNYTFYKDIDIDNNGSLDYRGVYFTRSSNSHQTSNGYDINTAYWFKYELMEWTIVKEEDGKAMLVSDVLIDSRCFNNVDSNSSFDHNGGNGYSNNYALSDIRKFLNEELYDLAFTDAQKLIIETTEVDNSVSQGDAATATFACANTNDKLFLLSHKEVCNIFNTMNSRTCKGTEYAKCMGVWCSTTPATLGNGYYWLRSPYCYPYGVSEVYDTGRAYGYGVVDYTEHGVRPALWIKL